MKKDSSESTSRPDTDYLLNIGPFIKSFFSSTREKTFAHQFVGEKGVLEYNPSKLELTHDMLEEHFYAPPSIVSAKTRYYGWVCRKGTGDSPKGSMAAIPANGGKLKFVCFDLDDEKLVKKAEQALLPKLRELKISHIEELGGDNLERRHLWIKVDCSQAMGKKFFTLFLRDLYGYDSDVAPFQEGEFDEVFGVNKPTNLIRIPLGFHLKRSCRFPVIIDDGLTTNPGKFVKKWVELPPLTEERMIELCQTFKIIEAPKRVRAAGESKEFVFFPRKMKLPMDNVPRLLKPVFENCQAANGVLEDIVTENLGGANIKEAGGVHHWAGVFMAGLAAYSDVIRSTQERKIFKVGFKWFDDLVEKHRVRDDESHSWLSSFHVAKSNPNRVFPTCEKWEEKFDKCRGCPFKGSVETPKQFIWGTRINRTTGKQVKLTDMEHIRNTTFIEVRERINFLLENGQKEDMLLASPQGSGKSKLIDDLTCDLASRGFRVLIAVPSTTLALQHRANIKACGTDAFVLSSHKSIFTKGISKFDCPDFDEIQRKVTLGVSTGNVKNTNCSRCPLYDECYYPMQYKEVMAPEHRIVIIQHAHFSAPEIMYELQQKQFDILFIDETFINNVYASLPINEYEKNLLESYDYRWTKKLFSWLSGELPKGKLEPKDHELEDVKNVFDRSGLTWRIPELIRHYNRGASVNPYVGIEVVYDLPSIPIRVLTDATPPEGLIKNLTGIESLVVYGRDEVIDYRKIHPEHKILQVLDYSASVSKIKKEPELFEEILMKIAELVELKYTNHKVLLACYKNLIPEIEAFFATHLVEFPTARSRITLDWMSKGSNRYEDYDVQFLLCSVYYTGNQYLLDAYKYKVVANHYNTKTGRELIPNNYPHDLVGMASVESEWNPVSRIMPEPGAAEYFYEHYKESFPLDLWHGWIWRYNNSNTQQAIRLRFKPDKLRTVYLLTNASLPGFLITDSFTISDFVKPLDDVNKLI